MQKSGPRPSALRVTFTILVLSLFVLLLIGALLLFRIFGTERGTRTVTVPDLCGASIHAISLPDAALFQTVTVERFSDAPVGTVLSQSPAAGTLRKAVEGKHFVTVTLTVSKGRERATIPDVTGLPLPRGEALLLSEGFPVKVAYRSDAAPYGEILAQSPARGTECDTRTTVTLTVSRGAAIRRVRVPDVMGYTERQARSLIEAAGLSVGTVHYANADGAEGRVLRQMPVAPTVLPEGSRVDLTASRLPQETEDSDGTSESEAETESKPESETETATESETESAPPSAEDLIDRILDSLFP